MLEYLSSTTSLVFSAVFLFLWLSIRRPSNSPPGPPLIPFIGNIPSMGKDPRESFAKLRKRYGDIFCIYVFNVPVVVINSYKLIRQALVKQADVFSGRPHNAFFDMVAEGKGIVFVDGTMWKEQRQVSLTILREFGMGKAILETKIHKEIKVFLDEVAKKANRPQDLSHLIVNAVSNIMCNLIFGKRFEYTDKKFVAFLKRAAQNASDVSGVGLATVCSALRFIPGDPFCIWQFRDNMRAIEAELIKPCIEEHVKNYNDGDAGDFISAYLRETKKRNGEDTTISESALVGVVGELFMAGSETTTTALRWLLVGLVNYPEIQQKCFEEVQEHIGLNRMPSMKDKQNTPYIDATLMEVLRFFDIAPLSLPHALSEDTVFNGYTLKKGTFIIANLDSALHDPDVWGDPQNFRPERFLDGSKMVKSDEFIPFSAGRRACLGEAMARMELFLFATSMIQKFEFLPPAGQKIPLKGHLGLTHSPRPYEVIAKPRS